MMLSSLTTPSGFRRIIRVYTSSATWIKQPGLKMIQVICVGAGGGGAAGALGASGTARQSGAGGGGGSITNTLVMEKYLSYYEEIEAEIIVGAGGAGGIGRSTAGGAVPGTSGSQTVFSLSSVTFFASAGLGAGTGTSGGSGGNINACNPNFYPSVPGVAGGGGSSTGSGSAGSNGMISGLGAPGGSGGGAISSGNVAFAGAQGSRVRTIYGGFSPTQSGGLPPGGNGLDGLDNQALQLLTEVFADEPSLSVGIGSGGAGGASGNTTGTINGGKGGNAGNYGAGGGGGGAATVGAVSGSGGNGANGLCIVVEYY